MSSTFIVDRSTDTDTLYDPVVAGERKSRGYDPSYIDPVQKAGMRALPSDIKVPPRSEWSARCKEQKERRSSLYHRKLTDMANGKPHQSLDQNGQGFCWKYGNDGCAMYARAATNLPYVRFSPHAGACVIKGFRDQGGWCGLAHRFDRGEDPNHPGKGGFMPESRWPQKSMSRQYDTAENWAEAAKYRIVEDVYDPLKGVYDQDIKDEIVAGLLLLNIPVQVDYNEWGHSVVAISWEEFEPGAFGPRIDNSWTPDWGENGTGIIKRWDIDGATGIVVVGRRAA